MKPLKVFDYNNYSYQGGVLYLKNQLGFSNAGDYSNRLRKFLPNIKERNITIDCNQLESIDSAGVAAIYNTVRILNKKGITTSFTAESETIKEKLELFKPPDFETHKSSQKNGFLLKIGDLLYKVFKEHALSFLYLIADISYWTIADIFNRKQRRKGEFVNQAVNIGVNALPIVLVLTFIIGMVISVQSATQLRNYGANIFIVDLIVISMMAQMGPLITAILVAGRSGSAIAAEIATMKVTSEIDALKTMGLNPLRYVVIPKIYGGIITMPFLTMLANVAGIAGGALASYIYLDITPEIFINRMSGVLYQKDIITSIIKSIVYINLIVITGCYFGLRVEKGAEGVGKSTTKSVVAAISLVIVADLIMGLIFYR
ncbi:ABC transporter permease [Natronoflexus pectinivorans]|uniref:Phospholipid/cholesterol/gamma-HCH transport system permease protein n=1 Tax=Natronoflexus pectinivorans TaxID=682526 RepID=A0A4R2GJR0_9BACT|nr:MlaE family lipid ABC transporter permease subunit [Natronoflexus pectinivorans]TCO07640.1 phospholipid/cholesterol/gamma-HCH transport system permease protein [Natronoflexus pectinivorans]